MATTNGTEAKKGLTKAEREMIIAGLGLFRASQARMNDREIDQSIKEIREQMIARIEALRNKLASGELDL